MREQDRDSIIVKMGRAYQKISPIFSFVDLLFEFFIPKKSSKPKVVCLLATPRSGSTLTYQILNSGIKSLHLTNIWNLFYATPIIGGLISKQVTKNYSSSFNSQQGFVPGLKGEAEGLKFWSHWSGQNLNQDAKWDKAKASQLEGKINRITSKDEAFITGYLGHVFCIDKLRELFPNIIFIHLQRDLLSNARSIYNASPEKWFSSRPLDYNNQIKKDRFNQIAYQLLAIHKEIWKKKGEDFIVLDVNKIGMNPAKAIEKIIAFAKEKNISLAYSHNYGQLTQKSFNINKADPNADHINEALFNALTKGISSIQNKSLKDNLEQLLHD